MFSTILSIFSEEAAAAASVSHHGVGTLSSSSVTTPNLDQPKSKKKRNPPGNPADPDAEVIALSPKTLLATNRFVCEICSKGFQRDQNLQLHRRGHNLPWKLKQRNNEEARKRVYVCPESTCVHHDPSRALGDLTGIKKHFCRKHGEKKWKCEKCSKIYAVQSDWKAHSKTCGTREYRCDCGTLFSRKDNFVTHRAFCDALAEESARLCSTNTHLMTFQHDHYHHQPSVNASDFNLTAANQGREITASLYTNFAHERQNPNRQISLGSTPFFNTLNHHLITKPELTVTSGHHQPLFSYSPPSAVLSATALLQKAATIGATSGSPLGQTMMCTHMSSFDVGLTSSTWPKTDSLTRDFLGLTAYEEQRHVQCTNGGDNQLLTFAETDGNMGVSSGFPEYDRSMFKAERGFGSWRHC